MVSAHVVVPWARFKIMSTVPFRREPKIGRNDPCPCGNKRKFKNCHGGPQYGIPHLLASAALEKSIVEEGKRQLERRRALEMQRQKQQGLGKPIISAEFKGYRFVAVGSKVTWGKWKSVADFLQNYVANTLGREWGNAEIAKPFEDRHPFLQWYEHLCRLQSEAVKNANGMFTINVTGAVSAYHRLAYNLYLIAHNVKDIQTRLIKRIKNKGNFQGAFFEAQVAAWLIKAGFELEYEDETDHSSKHHEFTATYAATGEKFAVEAKSRELKRGGSARTPVGKQVRQALEKPTLHKRLVVLDLNKSLYTPEAASRALDRAKYIIKQLEGLDIDGRPAPAAYVLITNMNDQHALNSSSLATAISFVGFKINDFIGNEFPSLLAAVRARERHWPMFQLLSSIEEHGEIPQTFGGELPSAVFPANPPSRLRIGKVFRVPGPDGTERAARITTATVMGGLAYCGFHDVERDDAWIGTIPLTPEEIVDYSRFTDTFFGVYQSQGRRAETQMELFDFFFDGFKETPKARLLEMLAGHPDKQESAAKSQLELAETVAEAHAMHVAGRNAGVKPSILVRGGPLPQTLWPAKLDERTE